MIKMWAADIEVTCAHFWVGSVVMGLVDIVLLALLSWRIKPVDFRQLGGFLVGSAATLWSVIGWVAILIFWEAYYRNFYPGWMRAGGLLLYVPLLYGGIAWVFHRLSLRMAGNPLVNFCLLGGLASVLEHLWGIYGLKILEIPLLQGVNPFAILVFSVPEYVCYWCMVIVTAALCRKAWLGWVQRNYGNVGNR